MENWTPQDIVLIVSTTANAIAAIGGVLVPIALNILSQRANHRSEARKILGESIGDFLNAAARMNHAAFDAGFPGGDAKGFSSSVVELDQHSLRLYSLALSMGLDIPDPMPAARGRVISAHDAASKWATATPEERVQLVKAQKESDALLSEFVAKVWSEYQKKSKSMPR